MHWYMAVTVQWLFNNYTMIENYTFLRNESQSLKFLYFRQNVFSAKSPFVKLSVRQTVRSTNCPFDKLSVDKMSVRQNVFRQSVFQQSVFRQNVRPPVAMLCFTLSTMLCCTLSTTIVNNRCSQLFTFNNHCSIIVDNHQQAFFINYCQLMFQQHCNNYILLFVNIEQLLIEQCSSTLSIQQVLLNLDNNIVQALFNEQLCINLINFCACMPTLTVMRSEHSTGIAKAQI